MAPDLRWPDAVMIGIVGDDTTAALWADVRRSRQETQNSLMEDCNSTILRVVNFHSSGGGDPDQVRFHVCSVVVLQSVMSGCLTSWREGLVLPKMCTFFCPAHDMATRHSQSFNASNVQILLRRVTIS